MEKEKKVSKLKAMAGKKITAEDIFTNHYQIWAFIPLFLYLLTPVVHMIVYAILYRDEMTIEEYNIYMNTGEFVGDNYVAIIQFAMFIGAFITVVALGSFLSYKKLNSLRRFPDNIPMLFFICYVVLIIISTIVNKTSYNLIFGFSVRAEGVVSLLVYYLVYYFCGSLISNENMKRFVAYFFLLTGVVIGVLTLIDFYGVEVNIISEARVSGIFYHWNFYAYYLSISIPLSAGLVLLDDNKIGKLIGFISFLLDTFILALNDSMGGFLASTVALAFILVAVSIKNKKFSFGAIGMIVMFMAIIFVTGMFYQSFFSEIINLGSDVKKIVTDSSNAAEAGTARWNLWTHTAKYIKEKPFIGWGFEGTSKILQSETNQSKVHNEYLENMADFGIPAGILYLAALISVYIKAFIRRHKIDSMTICCLAAALGYIGSALVGNSFIFMAPFCFIFLGLANQTIPSANIEEKISKNHEETPEEVTEDGATAEEPEQADVQC